MYKPNKYEYPILTEEQSKEKELIIKQCGWEFHYSKGTLILVLPI